MSRCVLLLLVCALGFCQPSPPGPDGGPPGPPEGPPEGPAAAAPNGAGGASELAAAIWRFLNPGGTPPPSMGPPLTAPLPSGAASSPAEEPPWRRSRSRAETTGTPPTVTVTPPVVPPVPPVVPAPPMVPAAPVALPVAPAAHPVNLTAEPAVEGPGPNAKGTALDLRKCKVCRETSYAGKGYCVNFECVPWLH